jgi:aminomethyltransferase
MPLGTPFHARTAALSASQNWRTWSGYTVASSYAVVHDPEYHAIRNSAALIDVSPLYKYDIRGKDALRFVNRVISRDAAKCAVQQALYACLCDDGGKVIQDGTVFRLGENHFRFNLAEPSLRWFRINAVGMAVDIQDASEQVAAVALQGPTSRDILKKVTDANLDALKFFRLTFGTIAGVECMISRTGYTGDLGYEIWLPAKDAEKLWDCLMDAGKPYGITPAGLLALDLARLEAGFILLEVDYTSAEKAMIPSQKYSPFEIGLSWTVSLEKENFVGRTALLEEKRRGSSRQLIGLEIDWDDYERLYVEAGLAPQLPTTACRGGVPVYRGGTQLGQATTSGWSPTIKKYIALATVQSQYSEPGTEISMEVTVEYVRKRVKARAVKTPFFDPPRKRS